MMRRLCDKYFFTIDRRTVHILAMHGEKSYLKTFFFFYYYSSLLRGRRRRFMCDAKCKHAFNLVALNKTYLRVYLFIYFVHTAVKMSPRAEDPATESSSDKCYNMQIAGDLKILARR